jgi:hypothetical protein
MHTEQECERVARIYTRVGQMHTEQECERVARIPESWRQKSWRVVQDKYEDALSTDKIEDARLAYGKTKDA